jgi:hypothetical protein
MRCRSTIRLVRKAVRASVQVKTGQGEPTIDEIVLDHSAARVARYLNLKPFGYRTALKHGEIPVGRGVRRCAKGVVVIRARVHRTLSVTTFEKGGLGHAEYGMLTGIALI